VSSLLGVSPASDFCMPTFWNYLSVQSSKAYPAFEDGTDRWLWNVGMQKSGAGDTPKRLLTISKTQRKFEIKNKLLILCYKIGTANQSKVTNVNNVNKIVKTTRGNKRTYCTQLRQLAALCQHNLIWSWGNIYLISQIVIKIMWVWL
jgi:hypothetical protein